MSTLSTALSRTAISLILSISLTWQVLLATQLRCYTDDVCGNLFVPLDGGPKSCCIDTPNGITYDYGNELEICYHCQVVGWKRADVYTIANTTVELIFGKTRGSISSRMRFRVDYVANEANVMVNSSLLDGFNYAAQDISVSVRVPPHSGVDSSMERTATLRIVLIGSSTLPDGRLIHPQEVVIHVVVPQLQFEAEGYSLQFPESASTPVCLTYNASADGFVSFQAEVTVTKQAADDSDEGGQVYTYFFTEDMSFSCQTLALPVSQLEQYRDTVFIASINIPQGSVFQLGPPSTATITVEVALVQFAESSYTLESVATSIEVCLVRSHTETGLAVNVSLTKGKEEPSLSYLYVFAENESVSCQSITVPQSDAELRLDIVVPSTPTFQLGPRSIATITIDAPTTSVSPTDEDTSADNTGDTTAVDPSTEETTEEEEEGEEEEEEEGEEEEEEEVDGSGDDNKELEVEVDIDRVGDDALPNDAASLNKDRDSRSSGTPSWAIAISVVLPVLVILTSVAVVIGALVYRHNHYTSYSVSKL